MKNKVSPFTRKGFLLGAFLLAFAAAAAFWALRSFWVFYSPNIPVLGAMGVFLLLALLTGTAFVLLVLRMWEVRKKEAPVFDTKAFRLLGTVVFFLGILFFIGVTAILLMSGQETLIPFFLWLKKDAPGILGLLLLALAIALLPAKRGKQRAALALALALAAAFWGITQVFPPEGFRLNAPPAVFDTGEDYAVVFTTSAKGAAFVELDDGQTVIWAEQSGRRVADRLLHAVNVPYEALNGRSYRVGATRVIDEFSYGARLGRTVRSSVFTFSAPAGETQRWLTVSDWHTYVKQAMRAVSFLGEYDGAILLGDPAPGMDFEEEAAVYLADFAGRLTGGTKPVVYVRGNHETRGAFADRLPEYLGFKRFDYTVDFGPYAFVVLDSGEDKADDHIEYGGLNDFRRNREEVVERLEALRVSSPHVIALSHAWQVSEPEPELSDRAWTALDRLGVRFMLSGHTHRCRFVDGESDSEKAFLAAHPGVDVYMDGGHRGKTYVASLVTLTPEGAVFTAVGDSGQEALVASLPWEKTE